MTISETEVSELANALDGDKENGDSVFDNTQEKDEAAGGRYTRFFHVHHAYYIECYNFIVRYVTNIS